MNIATNAKRQVIDITDTVQQQVPTEGAGLMHVFVQHTTAAITTADLDPGTDLDLLDALSDLIAPHQWRHPHNPLHAPDHLLASIVGPDVTVPYTSGRLQLGTWQRIILIELDGPRERSVLATPIGA